MNDKEIIKCDKCGHVLIGGDGNIAMSFSKGCSIGCRVCGNKHVFQTDFDNENNSKGIKFQV